MVTNDPVILKTSVLVATAAAIVFAILSVGNPLVLFVNATASRFATSAPQDGTGQSMPIVQSTAGAQALPPTASEAPTGNEIAAAFKAAFDSQTEIRQPPAEALLNQFQAWAAEEDLRAPDRPVQSVQDTQAQCPSKGRAKCPSKGAARAKCTSTGPALANCPGTVAVARAKTNPK
jgi:hypothetical protein